MPTKIKNFWFGVFSKFVDTEVSTVKKSTDYHGNEKLTFECLHLLKDNKCK